MQIRDFRPGDEAALRDVFHSSVHQLAKGYYTPSQLDAWAPASYDEQAWSLRLSTNRPFVALDGHGICGYADLQPSGLIDQFFVAGHCGHKGVGHALMLHLQDVAVVRGIHRLFSDVSLAAEAFFARHGFVVEQRQEVWVRGAMLNNARMVKRLE